MLKKKISLGLIVVLVMNLMMSMGAFADSANPPTLNNFTVNGSNRLDDIGSNQAIDDVLVLTFDQSVVLASGVTNDNLKGNFTIEGKQKDNSSVTAIVKSAELKQVGAISSVEIQADLDSVSTVVDYTITAPAGVFVSDDTDEMPSEAISRSFSITGHPTLYGTDAITPSHNAKVVGTTQNIILKFSKPVKTGTGKITIKYSSNDDPFQVLTLSDTNLSSGRTVYTQRVSGFTVGQSYYVEVDGQAFQADNGLYLDAHGGKANWNFKVVANNIAWSSTVPGPGAINVSQSEKLSFVFNEVVSPSTGTIRIIRTDTTAAPISVNVAASNALTRSGNTILLDLSSLGGLASNATYEITVPAGAFVNSADNGTVDRVWSFTTGTQASTALSLSTLSPSHGSNAVPLRTIPTATFNRDIVVKNVSGVRLTRESTNSQVPSNVTYNGKQLIITPVADLLDNSTYYVDIAAGSIVDKETGNDFAGIRGLSTWTFSTTSNDKIAPVIQDATVYSNNTIRLRYNEALYSSGNLSTSYFTVSVNGENRRISSAYTSGEYVYVTLDLGIAVGQVVRISYTGSGTNGSIQDIARNAAAGFSNREVTNNIDSVLPKPKDGYVSGSTLYLSFSESLKSLSSSSAYEQFTVTANGSTKSIRSISSYNGSSSITLNLDSAVGNGEVIKVSYQPGSYPLQDSRGNNIAPFTDYFVRNTNDTIPPEFQSVEGAGNKIILTYNEPLRTTPLPLKSQFSVLVNNVAVYVTNVEIVSNQIILTLASSFTQDQAVTLSYVSGYGGTADLNGNLAGFINLQQVTYNNVAQGIRSAVVNGDVITITYNTTLRAVSFLPPNQFAVMVNNNPVGVQTATVSGNTVTLKLSTQVTTGQTVSLSYMTGTTPLIDTSGNKLNTFSSMTVTHSSASNNNTTTNGQPNFLSIMTSSTFNKVGYILNISTAKTSTTQSNRGRSINRYTIDSLQMQTAFKFLSTLATNRMLVFKVPQSERAAEVAIPLSALSTVSGGNQNVSFAVKYKENLYEVPIDGISLSEITRTLNVNTLNSAYLIIQMEPIERSQLGMPTVSNGVSISTLIDPIEIRIVVINGSGSANGGAGIKHSGKYYLRMNGSRVTSAQSTLVNYNTSINAMEHMLSSTSGSNGNLLYTAKVEGNSIIGPIMGSIFYSDINSHWAKADINELTSKLVVGPRSTGAITFDANRNITRGEFGEYIAKALGLTSDISSNSFPDVSANIRGGYINSAVKAGIITGYPDGTFKPEQFITREQMALMMVRAMSYANENITLNGTSAQTLSRFRDASGIQDKETVAKAVQSGIIQGITATSFQPKGNATRAQAVVMIRRVLSKINYL